MKTVILYESYFGNTSEIAKAIYNTLLISGETELHQMSEILWRDIADAEFFVVGSPTRGFGPCEKTKQFLKTIPVNGLQKKKVAVFDTRLSLPEIKSGFFRWFVKTGGFAAKNLAKTLKNKGGVLITEPEGFLVVGEKGPLVNGEIGRAKKWAEHFVKS